MRCSLSLPLVAAAALLSGPAGRAAEPPLRAVIDSELKAGWKKAGIAPAPRSSDAEFLRRVTLDLVGTVPTHDEAVAFLADARESKREKLIDTLLADPRFARQQADVWDQVLFGRHPGNADATRKRDGFKAWLAKQFADGTGFDRVAREVLVGEQPGTELFQVQFRNQPEEATIAVSRVFLGTQLGCAKCHDHPYDRWTQKDFYGMAGFFVRVVIEETSSGNTKTYTVAEKATGEVLFSGAAKDQQPGKKGEPVRPRFLGGDELTEPPAPKDAKEQQPKAGAKLPKPPFSRKEKFAEWVVAPENPYFARAVANRVWAQFMGRGIVHPADDFQAENAPSHPELLAALTRTLAASKYDLKALIREVVNSEAYQLAGTGPITDALPKHFERARVRPLTAEEIVLSLRTATSFDAAGKPPTPDDYFMRAFGEPTNGLGDFQGSLAEHLFWNNAEQVRVFARRKKGNLTDQLLASTDPWEKRVEHLYLSVLGRRPKPAEVSKFVAFITGDAKPEPRVEDAVWVLLTSSEFRFNH
ncbi:Uncharacterized protein OS=Pirellula staleyi (strain ATCC 27377 / DSM 6068 / ICPB 4128) GN=Psta_3482 PE=4 SV=1: PSCyt2: PSD1 [Gemmataceae bacterium]|nr:Uncharacterized protein OS=Pirellula staleyi (strain ATCC 27377 / DSM 6068 / ICPB 4128) GN=Psta_3482 PE=4 SV=1: PSCyt2: PSD1 [Gemmataceae bacterium]VTU01304.1 Uncharacterized protein OS=Pirellula staleyi (strain ATCC 27377 / DSM 6068 / ICPB 4128) GN=Psta_3482 PE=4 SV=1: PSCyt2: PSD1 [Gemmataceae bacterium]